MLGSPCSPCCGCRPIVYSWGDNTTWQLGNCQMSGTVVAPPDFVDQLDWSQLAGGAYAGAGIENGNLWTWGGGGYADIGWGDVGNTFPGRWIPRQIPGTWSYVALCASVLLAIDNTGRLFSCGTNTAAYGKTLGLPNLPDEATVYPLTQVGSWDRWTQVHGSFSSACGVQDGKIFYWGNSNANEGPGQVRYETPRALSSFTPSVQKVQDSGEYRMALTTSGDLYAWWFWDISPNPTLIDSGVQDFSLTDYYRFGYVYPSGRYVAIGAVYLKTNGTLKQAPISKLQNYRVSERPDDPLITFPGTWLAVAGSEFGMAVNTDGYLYTWGSDRSAGLGNGPSGADVNAPTQIGTKKWRPVIACGANAAYAKAIQ